MLAYTVCCEQDAAVSLTHVWVDVSVGVGARVHVGVRVWVGGCGCECGCNVCVWMHYVCMGGCVCGCVGRWTSLPPRRSWRSGRNSSAGPDSCTRSSTTCRTWPTTALYVWCTVAHIGQMHRHRVCCCPCRVCLVSVCGGVCEWGVSPCICVCVPCVYVGSFMHWCRFMHWRRCVRRWRRSRKSLPAPCRFSVIALR